MLLQSSCRESGHADHDPSAGQRGAVRVPTGNTRSALLLLDMWAWSCGCGASARLPDPAAPASAHALPVSKGRWDSSEFPQALGATVLSVHLLRVAQRSGLLLIPAVCPVGHRLHPIQNKPNSDGEKKAKYGAKSN